MYGHYYWNLVILLFELTVVLMNINKWLRWNADKTMKTINDNIIDMSGRTLSYELWNMSSVCTCSHWCDVNHKIPKGLVGGYQMTKIIKKSVETVFPLELWKMLFFPEHNWYGSDEKWVDICKLEHANPCYILFILHM